MPEGAIAEPAITAKIAVTISVNGKPYAREIEAREAADSRRLETAPVGLRVG